MKKNTKFFTSVIIKGSLKLDIISITAFVDDDNLQLSPKEFSLLLFLMLNEGKRISAEEIYERVWKLPLIGSKSALTTAISKLRKKIERSGYTLESLRGQGYTFLKD